jgi:serine/threonine-protein kinase RsbW
MRRAFPSQRTGEGWTLHTRGRDIGIGHRRAVTAEGPGGAADLRLSVPATPEHVKLLRHVVGELAQIHGMPDHVRVDLKLAITEACTNVVRHAYREPGGRVEVIARPRDDSLEVMVSDTGVGITPSPDRQGPGYGLGLLSVLADRLEIDHAPGQGSHLRMWFAHNRPLPETA